MRLASGPPFSARRIGRGSTQRSAAFHSVAGTWQDSQVFFSTTSRKSWILYTGQSGLLQILSALEIGKICGGGCLL